MKFFYSILFLLGSIQWSYAQTYNPEDTIPTDWQPTGSSTLTISDAHYRVGDESLRWDWNGGDSIKIDDPGINPSHFFQWGLNHFEMWAYSEVNNPTDTFHVEFFNNTTGGKPFRFYFMTPFTGWRKITRSYRFDMLKNGDTWGAGDIVIKAPKNRNGAIFFDDIKWMTGHAVRQSDRQMPDLHSLANDTYGSGDFYYQLDQTPPSIPRVVPCAQEISEINQVKQTVINTYRGGSPSAAAIASLNIHMDTTYNIVCTGDQIKGKAISDPSQIGDLLLNYARHYQHTGKEETRQRAEKLVRLLLDSGIAGGSGSWIAGGSNGYDDRNFFIALSLLGDAFAPDTKVAIFDWLNWSVGTGNFWGDAVGTFNTDDIHVLFSAYYSLLMFAPSDRDALQIFKGYQNFLNRYLSPQPGRSDGIKIDGTGFHHATHHNAYMYAHSTLANSLNVLRGTSFQISKSAYLHFRQALLSLLFNENGNTLPNSTSGRAPHGINLPVNAGAYKIMTYIGGEIMGQTVDEVLAAAYHRKWGATDNTFAAYATTEPLAGFWQQNYSPMATYRKDNWAAGIKGFTDMFWGTEIYSNGNRYGRYQSYGAVEVIYPTGRVGSGFNINGWNWNMPPGATTIHLPWEELVAPQSRFDEYQQKAFTGALRFIENNSNVTNFQGFMGVFAIDFQQTEHPTSHKSEDFKFRKSVFCYEDKMICLGSGIQNSNANRITATNLFQNYLINTTDPIIINNNSTAVFPMNQNLTANSESWLIDAYQTGYFVRNSDELIIERKNQDSPHQLANGTLTNGDFANAYINHGFSPSDKKYEYVILPNTNTQNITDFANDMSDSTTELYEVIQQDNQAHIIKIHDDSLIGHVLFEANSLLLEGLVVKANDQPCLIFTQLKNDSLKVALTNPDVNLVNGISTEKAITITLNGNWNTWQNDEGVTEAHPTDSTTTLTFKTIDGLPFDAQLIRAKATLKLLINPKLDILALEMPTPNTPYTVTIKDVSGNTVYTNNQSINQISISTLNWVVDYHEIFINNQLTHTVDLQRDAYVE